MSPGPTQQSLADRS